jgi:hypothetical protein
VATVVFHSIVWQYVEAPERERIHAALEEAGARSTPGAPLAWLRMEPAAGRHADGPRVDLRLWPGGTDRLVARAGYHGRPVRWLA